MDEKGANRAGEAAQEMERLARESYRAAVDHAFDVQKSGMRISRRFFENWLETLEDHAEINRRTMRSLTELVQEQREVFRVMARESLYAYDGFVDSLASYHEEVSKGEED